MVSGYFNHLFCSLIGDRLTIDSNLRVVIMNGYNAHY
jgi:hypothetical protein